MITNPRACSAVRPYRPDRQPSTQSRNLTEPCVCVTDTGTRPPTNPSGPRMSGAPALTPATSLGPLPLFPSAGEHGRSPPDRVSTRADAAEVARQAGPPGPGIGAGRCCPPGRPAPVRRSCGAEVWWTGGMRRRHQADPCSPEPGGPVLRPGRSGQSRRCRDRGGYGRELGRRVSAHARAPPSSSSPRAPCTTGTTGCGPVPDGSRTAAVTGSGIAWSEGPSSVSPAAAGGGLPAPYLSAPCPRAAVTV
ncbi:hypothetical protein a10_07628 [Streptomyces acidiscabies]|nr:hypothetical protein a10_07628 [Streptomyces acidiscabies]GAV42635.1 hypothetical protein Saa2_05576 [Streptomyces acidiscabies]